MEKRMHRGGKGQQEGGCQGDRRGGAGVGRKWNGERKREREGIKETNVREKKGGHEGEKRLERERWRRGERVRAVTFRCLRSLQ